MAVSGSIPERGRPIFVTYREKHSSRSVVRVLQRLLDAFGRDRVFISGGTSGTGSVASSVVDVLAECEVMLALIGRTWRGGADATKASSARIPDLLSTKQRDGFVWPELDAALRQGVEVIPVLLDGVELPAPHELPPTISLLARARPRRLSVRPWRTDLDRLIDELRLPER